MYKIVWFEHSESTELNSKIKTFYQTIVYYLNFFCYFSWVFFIQFYFYWIFFFSERQVLYNISFTDNFFSGFYSFSCERKFNNLRNLKKHEKFDCGKAPKFLCPFCAWGYRIHSNLKSHMMRYRHDRNIIKIKFRSMNV